MPRPPLPPTGRWTEACRVRARPALLLAAVAALLMLWAAVPRPPAPAVAPPQPVRPIGAPTTALTTPPTAAFIRTPAAAPGVARRTHSAPAPDSPTAPAGDSTEVCGWGPVQLPPDDPFPLQRLPAATRNATLDEARATMAADPDLQVRAAGLLLAARSGAAGARQRAEQLARLAAASSDATAYAMALQACRGLPDPAAGACGLLGSAQAAQLAPDDASPWLALAAEAAARQDAEAEHDAMRRAAQATRLGAPTTSVPLLVAQSLSAPGAALPRTLALGLAFGLQDIDRLLPPPGGVAQARAYCLAGAEPDADARATTCRRLGAQLLQHGRAVAELGAGLDIARRWWPTLPGLAAWQQEHDALVDTAPPLPDGIDLGCAAQQRQLDWLRRVAAVGERVALREQLAAAGHSLTEWSARHRRSLQLAQATVAAVAAGTDERPPEAER